MKPTAWQKQDLIANNTSPEFPSLLERIRIEIESQSDSSYLDALVLLTHLSGKSKAELLAHPNPELTSNQESQLVSAIEKIKVGVPLPYVLGVREFFGLQFKITPAVLIPRPESEWLVETGINWLRENPSRRTCLDLGTGSGCLAVAAAHSIQDLNIIAVDISYSALLVARENARGHQVQDRIKFITSDLLNGVFLKVDLAIANLPYIPSEKLIGLPVYRTEPHQALDGGPDGLSYIRDFLEKVPDLINPGGLTLLELDEDRGENALLLAKESLPEAEIHLNQDLAGQDRYLQIKIP
jgi:release factor glutamine methyltransferase